MRKNSVSNIANQKYVFAVHMPVMEGALCFTTKIDPDAFFPNPRSLTKSNKEAKALCKKCPVQSKCLSYALENDIWFGIWGGTTATERNEMLGKKRGYNGSYRSGAA